MSDEKALSTEVKVGAHLAIRTVNEALTLGKVLFESGFFSDVKSASQAVVKVMAGAELGFGPIASMSGVYVYNGRTAFMANLIASSVKRNGYSYKVLKLDNSECEIEFKDKGEVIGISAFTMDDAKLAGLTSGKNAHSWKNYPRNMLFARAISNGAKWFTPDIFGGVTPYTPDELDMPVDGETGEVIDGESFLAESKHEQALKNAQVVIDQSDGPTFVAEPKEMVTIWDGKTQKPAQALIGQVWADKIEKEYVGKDKVFDHAAHLKNHVREHFQVDFVKELTWEKAVALVAYCRTQQGDERGYLDTRWYGETIEKAVGNPDNADLALAEAGPITPERAKMDSVAIAVRWDDELSLNHPTGVPVSLGAVVRKTHGGKLDNWTPEQMQKLWSVMDAVKSGAIKPTEDAIVEAMNL